MKYFWLKDRKENDQFSFLWDYGDQNEGDYFTKHHPIHYHKQICPRYIKDVVHNLIHSMKNLYNMCTQDIIPSHLQGSVDLYD